jgi:hypothetical protein
MKSRHADVGSSRMDSIAIRLDSLIHVKRVSNPIRKCKTGYCMSLQMW